MGHVNQHDEDRYYIGLGDEQHDAIAQAIATVPDHHRAYAQVTGTQKLNDSAYLITTKILGADSRNDAGILREHLAQLQATAPDAARITKRTVAERIATLIDDGTTTKEVLAQAEQDAQNLAGIEDLIDGAFADLDPQVAAALDAQS